MILPHYKHNAMGKYIIDFTYGVSEQNESYKYLSYDI